MEKGNISERVNFDFVRYANVWEDPRVLIAGFGDLEGKRILSIASSGDNCFALGAAGASVVAADINPAQIAITELKRQAFLALDYKDLLGFVGITPHSNRVQVYQSIKSTLPESVKTFWDEHTQLVERGIIHCGKFELYFQFFRKRLLPLVHSKNTIQQLLTSKDLESREEFYKKTWNSVRWRIMFKLFFSRFVMGRMGRDPEFFRYVEGSVGDRILKRAEPAFIELDPAENPYLRYILTGNFVGSLLDCYQETTFELTRAGMRNLTLTQNGIVEAGEAMHTGSFDGFNLSDIFEYLDQDTADSLYTRMFALANEGARFIYWNMLVPRERPENLADRIVSLSSYANELFSKDRACFYSSLKVEEVRSGPLQ